MINHLVEVEPYNEKTSCLIFKLVESVVVIRAIPRSFSWLESQQGFFKIKMLQWLDDPLNVLFLSLTNSKFDEIGTFEKD
jgi:hypothetical protein